MIRARLLICCKPIMLTLAAIVVELNEQLEEDEMRKS
jgi:hypothetical protein